MTYQPYLIANFATGLDKELQPWLLPDDAQSELYDGYIYEGVMNKRPGYQPLATGQRGGAPYCESRMVNRITSEPAKQGGTLVVGDGTAGPYAITLQNLPIRRGTVTITAGAQSATDNGLGVFTTTPAGGSGTINYTTGVISITFNAVVAIATQIFVTYDSHSGLPVMGVMNFTDAANTKFLIVADTKHLNIYNTTTNRLEYLGATYTITGITTANPAEITTSSAHNLTTGDKVFIYGTIGSTAAINNAEFTITVTGGTTFTIPFNNTGWTSGGIVQLIFSGTSKNFFSWCQYADKDGNPRLIFTNNVDEIGYYAPHLTPSVGDYIHYPTAASPDFQMVTDAGAPITSITCLYVFSYKDRLLLLRPTENGVIKPRRYRVSGTGANCDNFLTTATGAGKYEISDESWMFGADFNRDDLITLTETSTFVLKYTGNDSNPFSIQKIDESRGSGAPYGTITYLNRTTALSPRGMIISDGYRVERMDEDLPDFTFNEINNTNFEYVFAGTVDEDKDHYLLYPSTSVAQSDRILTTNYQEDNYSIYRFGMSCMGTYIQAFGITWNDLLIYPNWDSFASAYGDWNHFSFTQGTPFSVGGGHRGEIWQLAVNDIEDNPQKIRNITIIDANTLEITTDWNNYSMNSLDQSKGADTIYLTGVLGMVQANNKQYPIISITNNYTFQVRVPSTVDFSAYTSGGIASRVIPFSATSKKFNPFVNMDKKVRCGWLYFYVSTTGTSLTRNIAIIAATQANPCVITTNVNHNLQSGNQVSIFGVGGMTQLNDKGYFITVLSPTSFSLNGINSTAYGAYTSGGYAAVTEKCKIDVEIITNDAEEKIQVNNLSPNPIQCNCTNLVFEEGNKKWYKTYINQTGRFVQFRTKNLQAGAKIQIHAMMPGFQAVGRLV